MNDHDELDQIRREVSQLGTRMRDAGMLVAALAEAHARETERAHGQAERARDRAEQRAERAMRLAERAQRRLHAQWRAADRAATADLAIELEAARTTRAEQEQLVGQWAWAQAHADENPEAARGFDARLLAETGIDPAALRNPFAATDPASERTQPFTPVDLADASGTATPRGHHADTTPRAERTEVGPELDDTEPTVLDVEALIQGLIQAAHPNRSASPVASQSDSSTVEMGGDPVQELTGDVGLGA